MLIAAGFLRRAVKDALEENKLIVVCFHNPEKNCFNKIIRWLKNKGFTIVSSEDVIKFYNMNGSLPKGAVWITLDDGWRGNLLNVLPILEDEKVYATIFACSNPIETDGIYWWSLASKYLHLLPEKYQKNYNLLWKIPESERKKITSDLYEKTGARLPSEALTVEELKRLAASRYITIGSHTMNHVITSNCSEEELIEELEGSKKKLEEWTGKKVNIFAYPNAVYSECDEKFLSKTGYEIAVIGGNRAAGKNDACYRIPRMGMGEGYFYEELCHVFGVWQRFIKPKVNY